MQKKIQTDRSAPAEAERTVPPVIRSEGAGMPGERWRSYQERTCPVRREQPLVVSVCDPDPNDLAIVWALVENALAEFRMRRWVRVRGYSGAKSLLAAPPCDLCITEVDLGDTDVFTLVKAVRERKPEAQIIFLSRCRTDDIAPEVWKAGVTQYIAKPVETQEQFLLLQKTMQETCHRLLFGAGGPEGGTSTNED